MFKPVTFEKRNCHTFDQLDGKDLIEGEWVRVEWPRKDFPLDFPSTEHFVVYLDKRPRRTMAFIIAPIHGTTNRLYLRFQRTVLCERMTAPL